MLTKDQFEQLASFIVRAIRGNRSQNSINMRLGYSYNQVSKWETGAKKIKWNELLLLCEACKIDIQKNLQHRFQYIGKTNWKSFFRFLADQNFEKKLLETHGFSFQKIHSWYLDDSNPFLHDCLKVFESHSPILLSFCSIFADISELPFLQERISKTKSEAQLIGEYPVSGFILCSLELESYKTSDLKTVEFMEHYYGISPHITNICLEIAMQTKLVISTSNGKHALNQVEESPNTDLATMEQRKNVKHSLSVLASEIIRNFPDNSVSTNSMRNFSHMYFGANKESAEAILKATGEYFKKIREINIAAKPPFDRVGVLNLHIFDDIFMKETNISLKDM